MNKLIIISLVIFFAICSKSWADDRFNTLNKLCYLWYDVTTNRKTIWTQEFIAKKLTELNYSYNDCKSDEQYNLYKKKIRSEQIDQNLENNKRNEAYKKEQELIKRNREKHNPEAKRKREIEERNRKIAKEKREQEIITKKEKQLFENAKAECEAIGYKKGTEKFGECVLDLTE